jgi:hypothetical protein
MRSMLILLAAAALLPACHHPAATPADHRAASAVTAHWGEVKYTAQVNAWGSLRENPYLHLEVFGKPKLGETGRGSIYYVTVAGKRIDEPGRRHVLFGKDGGLYIAAKELFLTNQGPYKEQMWDFGTEFHRIGSYQAAGPLKTGTAIDFKLEPGVAFERGKTAGVPAWVDLKLERLPAIAKNVQLIKDPSLQ